MRLGSEGRRGRGRRWHSRRFRIGVGLYVAVVLGLLAIDGWASFVAELLTLPVGLVLFAGGASGAAAIGGLLGRFGPVVWFGSFAAIAVLNAVVLSEALDFARQRKRR